MKKLPRRHRHEAWLPAFSVTVALRDGGTVVTTAYLLMIADNDVALYEACLYGIGREQIDGIASPIFPPEHSLLKLRCLPDVIDL